MFPMAKSLNHKAAKARLKAFSKQHKNIRKFCNRQINFALREAAASGQDKTTFFWVAVDDNMKILTKEKFSISLSEIITYLSEHGYKIDYVKKDDHRIQMTVYWG